MTRKEQTIMRRWLLLTLCLLLIMAAPAQAEDEPTGLGEGAYSGGEGPSPIVLEENGRFEDHTRGWATSSGYLPVQARGIRGTFEWPTMEPFECSFGHTDHTTNEHLLLGKQRSGSSPFVQIGLRRFCEGFLGQGESAVKVFIEWSDGGGYWTRYDFPIDPGTYNLRVQYLPGDERWHFYVGSTDLATLAPAGDPNRYTPLAATLGMTQGSFFQIGGESNPPQDGITIGDTYPDTYHITKAKYRHSSTWDNTVSTYPPTGYVYGPYGVDMGVVGSGGWVTNWTEP
jgi:hypothetical protein